MVMRWTHQTETQHLESLVLGSRELGGLFLQAEVFWDMFIILQQYCQSFILSIPA